MILSPVSEMRLSFLVIVLFLNFCYASAQSHLQRRQTSKQLSYNELVVKKYIDTLQTIIKADTLTEVESVLNNPYYYPLVLTPTFYYFPVKNVMACNWTPKRIHSDNPLKIKMPVALEDSLSSVITRNLMWVYTQRPWLTTITEQDISNAEGIRADIKSPPVKENIKITPADNKIDLGLDDATINVVTRKPNFWSFGGSFSLQFSQSYISDNWYQGGNSNHSFLSTANLRANYNNKSKLFFENSLELRLGFLEYKDDKKHRYRTNDDKIFMSNKLGLQAFKNWYYTFLLQTQTQFYPNYSANSDYVNSDFLSPLTSNFSIGMEYKLNVKNFNLSANIGALSYNFKYVDRNNLRGNYGIRAPHSSDTEFGSTITINYTWNIFKNVSQTCRIYYYTNYERVQVDIENTTKFSFNKYLNTQLYLYPRFDDTYYKDGKSEFFQFKELWSLAFNYSF